MLRCITPGIPSQIQSRTQQVSFHQRKRLLLELLSCRHVPRVICAPKNYGKTVLASQYASQVFAAEDIVWIDASELSFLLALDMPVSDEFSARYLVGGGSKKVFVFDGCLHLSSTRFAAFESVIKLLLDFGHEVLLTTVDTRWTNPKEFAPLVIDACDLLLDEHEEAEWNAVEEQVKSKTASIKPSGDAQDEDSKLESEEQSRSIRAENAFGLERIAGFRRRAGNIQQTFFQSLVDVAIHDEREAIALLVVLLGSGSLHELNAFDPSFGTASTIYLEHHFPHCGVKRLEPMFQAASLSDDEKFVLLQNHLPQLTEALTSFSSEDELVATLVDRFTRRGEVLLATQLVCGLNDNEQKLEYFDLHAQSFLIGIRPLALLRLASALPRSSIVVRDRCQRAIIALGLLGDGKRVENALDAYLRRFSCDQERGRVEKGQPGSVSLPVSPSNAELFAGLVRIAFGTGFDRDPEALLPCVRACLEELRVAQEYSPAPLNFRIDLLEMIEQMLISPHDAIALLERIGARGHAVSECLEATSLFAQLFIHYWGDQVLGAENPESPDSSSRSSASSHRSHKDSAFLQRLEDHVARLLARQESTLDANSYELFLFEKAQYIFGDRIYLIASDKLLRRIEVGRSSLIEQRRVWRIQHRAHGATSKTSDRTYEQAEAKVLRINTLGRFEIESRDPSITIQSKVRKQLRLLISLLAIHEGREVSRPWIQRVMWPDAAERNAKQNLYTMWSLLNKSITDAAGDCPFFESFPQSMAINDQLVETDIHLLVDRCKRLRVGMREAHDYEVVLDELEDIYRGPLLPGLDTAEVIAHRKRYQDHLLDALIQGGVHLKKNGKTVLALRYFRFAFENDPTREDVCYQLMLVLWKLGRHGEAMNEYFVCHRALGDELGLECSTRLRGLYESILNDVS